MKKKTSKLSSDHLHDSLRGYYDATLIENQITVNSVALRRPGSNPYFVSEKSSSNINCWFYLISQNFCMNVLNSTIFMEYNTNLVESR